MKNLIDIIKEEGDSKIWKYVANNGTELRCEIYRNIDLGHLCGYIIITDDFEFYGKEFLTPPNCKTLNYYNLNDNGEYQVGFDCGGFSDIIPYLNHLISTSNFKTYKDMEYVKEECEILAEFISTRPSLKKIRRDNINDILE